jgi:Xaa-Pro aminopeptidase
VTTVGDSPFEAAEFAARHARVTERMEALGLDALLAYSSAKVKGVVLYLSNYSTRHSGLQSLPDGGYTQYGACALLFTGGGDLDLLIDQDWDLDRAREVSIASTTTYAESLGEELGRRLAASGHRRVGVDNWFIFPAAHYLAIRAAAPDVELVPTQLVEQVCKVKSPAEIALMRKAEDAAMLAMEDAMRAVRVGADEREIALAAEVALRTRGDLEIAGPTVIRGGPPTSTGMGLPPREGSHVMRSGDWALLDITPAYDGYAGDICRMAVAGSVDDVDPRLRRLYDVTVRINEEILAAIRPGVAPCELTVLADEIATSEGLGENRSGLIGHGLGLDIHEPPDYYYDQDPLEPNVVFTVEPFLAIAGLGGARVEDLVVVTETGCEVLSAACSKELRTGGG